MLLSPKRSQKLIGASFLIAICNYDKEILSIGGKNNRHMTKKMKRIQKEQKKQKKTMVNNNSHYLQDLMYPTICFRLLTTTLSLIPTLDQLTKCHSNLEIAQYEQALNSLFNIIQGDYFLFPKFFDWKKLINKLSVLITPRDNYSANQNQFSNTYIRGKWRGKEKEKGKEIGNEILSQNNQKKSHHLSIIYSSIQVLCIISDINEKYPVLLIQNLLIPKIKNLLCFLINECKEYEIKNISNYCFFLLSQFASEIGKIEENSENNEIPIETCDIEKIILISFQFLNYSPKSKTSDLPLKNTILLMLSIYCKYSINWKIQFIKMNGLNEIKKFLNENDDLLFESILVLLMNLPSKGNSEITQSVINNDIIFKLMSGFQNTGIQNQLGIIIFFSKLLNQKTDIIKNNSPKEELLKILKKIIIEHATKKQLEIERKKGKEKEKEKEKDKKIEIKIEIKKKLKMETRKETEIENVNNIPEIENENKQEKEKKEKKEKDENFEKENKHEKEIEKQEEKMKKKVKEKEIEIKGKFHMINQKMKKSLDVKNNFKPESIQDNLIAFSFKILSKLIIYDSLAIELCMQNAFELL
ncbi:hypothetical protein M0813_20437 [Anaeramoeba flamelloides]|uniref:Uncharacterized protein n=1 Tax=Anaeramoeba flamelloides TaxID=1746091 RepID=A0ABQ8YKV6_9EUKA|nr:hypothetical protein M0813_20437 [Anaeramoeba flamelloides]